MDITGLEHIHRYQLATILTKGKDVLGRACVPGYGSWMIAQDARSAYGVEFQLAYACVDIVASLEPPKRIVQADASPDECCLLLRPDQMLITCTPNS